MIQARHASRGRVGFVLTLASLAAAVLATPAAAATVPAGFTQAVLTTALSRPTAMALAPDGRIFVAEQGGAVRVIQNGSLLAAPFVTLTVNSSGERGVLGIAFDPNFASNNFVYVYYTATTPTLHNRVSRFTASGNVAAPGSELAILDLETLGASNHNGGAIHFGPDGKLYVAVGDNNVDQNAQLLTNRLGKILRINSDGTIPNDNPLLAQTSGANQAIWAYGLRNPYTFAFQPGTGRMFVNDVGENTWEEVNDGIAGSNYGWPATEGPTSNPSYRAPIFAYGHGSGPTTGCAISGGAFYNPSTSIFPATYSGKYFFADLCSGWVRHLDPASPSTASPFASAFVNPVDLKVEAAGSLLVLSGAGSSTGTLTRIQAQANGQQTAFPSQTTILSGSLRSGSAAQLAADDNSYFEVNRGSDGAANWYGSFTGIPNTASNLRITYSGSNSAERTQKIFVFKWNTQKWARLDLRSVGPGEVTISNLAPSPAPRHLVSGESGTGEVRVRIQVSGRAAGPQFFTRADLLQLSYTG